MHKPLVDTQEAYDTLNLWINEYEGSQEGVNRAFVILSVKDMPETYTFTAYPLFPGYNPETSSPLDYVKHRQLAALGMMLLTAAASKKLTSEMSMPIMKIVRVLASLDNSQLDDLLKVADGDYKRFFSAVSKIYEMKE